MAELRTSENRIMADINHQRQQATRLVYGIGLPAALIAAVVWPVGIPVWGLIWLGCFLAAKHAGSPEKLRGAAGEERALSVLSGLPEQYAVFNQIELPDTRSRTGVREADFIVVGPNGVFIIENKDFRGTIVGTEHDQNWQQHKIGRKGTPYVTYGRNPVRQVQTYVSLLAGIFRERGIKAWITPLVSLSRDNGLDGISSGKVQVVQATDLCWTILEHRGVLTEDTRGEVIRVLEELRQGQVEQGERKAA
jgi:hypothetical protein